MNTEISSKVPRWPFVIAIIALVVALPPGLPYGYYMLLRIIVCGVGIYGAVQAHERGLTTWVWVLGGIAVLFNPLIPVHLVKAVWVFIDVIGAVLLGIAAATLRRIPVGSF